MTKTLLLSISLLGIAFVLLGIKVLFVNGARFPSGHAHSSPQLRQRGVACEAHSAKSPSRNAMKTDIKPNQKIHDNKV